ncbi:MarR family winged helix-turn-helix transcriptional regulator [Actinophytocola sp.]|uniref:MarR family winged helix-turn-helix transcriptional regulator n=1 Tax=Actinophytocola sp. TaxID=1872138 RepID=UPI00389A226A
MPDREALTTALGAAMADLQAAIDADDQALADRLSVHRTDLRCLDLVFRHGPLPAGQLARMLGLTPGSVTALVDRLVTAGYVRRAPDPTHGRRVLVIPTEQAARIVTDLLRDRLAEAHAELADFSDAELDAIVRFLHSAIDRHERAAARLRGTSRPDKHR